MANESLIWRKSFRFLSHYAFADELPLLGMKAIWVEEDSEVVNHSRLWVLRVPSSAATATLLCCRLSSALSARFLRRCRRTRSCRGRSCLRLADLHNHRLQSNVGRSIFDNRIARLRLWMMNDEWRRLNDDRLRFDVNIRWLRFHNNRRLFVYINRFPWSVARLAVWLLATAATLAFDFSLDWLSRLLLWSRLRR